MQIELKIGIIRITIAKIRIFTGTIQCSVNTNTLQHKWCWSDWWKMLLSELKTFHYFNESITEYSILIESVHNDKWNSNFIYIINGLALERWPKIDTGQFGSKSFRYSMKFVSTFIFIEHLLQTKHSCCMCVCVFFSSTLWLFGLSVILNLHKTNSRPRAVEWCENVCVKWNWPLIISALIEFFKYYARQLCVCVCGCEWVC